MASGVECFLISTKIQTRIIRIINFRRSFFMETLDKIKKPFTALTLKHGNYLAHSPVYKKVALGFAFIVHLLPKVCLIGGQGALIHST